MKLKTFIAMLLVGIIAFAVYSSVRKNMFAPAQYLPRQALIYVQITDLPQFIKIWNESKFKDTYTTSQNFTDFQNRHLGRKLASRWAEFSDAVGFPIDLETISDLAEKQAAVAIYDIGKLEFVFIAPMNKEVFAATKFAQNQDKFTEETLEDETPVYRVSVEADRGRQKQELIFTNLKGHFILATSEKLLVQTLDNFNRKLSKNRLLDEPSFLTLRDQIEPHTATIWVNQTALNDDYYFKQYWLMSDVKNLKNIRAGIFDFEIGEGKLIEHRKFLLNQTPSVEAINPVQANQLLIFTPQNLPFYQLQTGDNKKIDQAIRKTIFERREDTAKPKSKSVYNYADFDEDDSDWHDYEYLGDAFDEKIDAVDENETVERQTIKFDFSKSFQSANPQAVLSFALPNVLPAPMFIEFKRASVISLAAPEKINRSEFESAIEKSLSAQVMISSPEAKLIWETKNENNLSWRELNLPMLGWNVNYVIHGNLLILTNNPEFLREILAMQKSPKEEKMTSNFSELTVLNFEQRENAYDKIFAEKAKNNIVGDFFTDNDDFFTENIGSLLDSLAEVKRVEMTRKFSPNLMEEHIVVTLKTETP